MIGKILLILLAVIVFLAAAVLLAPIGVIIKNNKKNELELRFKIWFVKFGAPSKKPKSKQNGKATKLIKEAFGLDKLSDTSTRAEGIKQTASLVKSVFEGVGNIFSHTSAKKLKLKIVCASTDPADAANSFGLTCAIVYPVVGFIKSRLKKVKKSGELIDIRCDFETDDESFDYDIELSVRFVHILAQTVKLFSKLQ